jgi:Cdc6-like AAA superfamily ATPase
VPNLDKRAIASENIKFSELNEAIRSTGRPLVLLIRNAERLVEFKKQILLYNLLEWIATDIKQHVALVFTTRLVYFVDKFEKRVRSRLAAKHLTVLRPTIQALLNLLLRRV